MTVQSVTIPNWVPESLANGSHGHWSTRQRKLRVAQGVMVIWGRQAGLVPLAVKAKLTITLTFPVRRRRDSDNLASRCKGLIDGLVKGGWLVDDDTEHLDLSVKADVRKGELGTHILLEPA